jgi:hypothetical protein
MNNTSLNHFVWIINISAWVDPTYELVQASIVPCNADLPAALRGDKQVETTG